MSSCPSSLLFPSVHLWRTMHAVMSTRLQALGLSLFAFMVAPLTMAQAATSSATEAQAAGINHSHIPTEIVIDAPGQTPYRAVITPSPKKKTDATPGFPGCETMPAPYTAGLWEITTVSHNSRMPQPITARIKRCITARDARNACGLNQFSLNRNHDCRITSLQVSGNTAHWGMQCANTHFSAEGKGESVFSSDAYRGKFEMHGRMQEKSLQMITTFSGRRLGDCH